MRKDGLSREWSPGYWLLVTGDVINCWYPNPCNEGVAHQEDGRSEGVGSESQASKDFFYTKSSLNKTLISLKSQHILSQKKRLSWVHTGSSSCLDLFAFSFQVGVNKTIFLSFCWKMDPEWSGGWQRCCSSSNSIDAQSKIDWWEKELQDDFTKIEYH